MKAGLTENVISITAVDSNASHTPMQISDSKGDRYHRVGIARESYRLVEVGALLVSVVLLVDCSGSTKVASPNPTSATALNETTTQPLTAVLVGAGDIARCGPQLDNAERTARLLDTIEGTIFLTGDLAYENGTRDEFQRCYHPTWGRHKTRTRPSPGNHEYYTQSGAPYYEYFGENAGPAGRGYYSFMAGSWRVFSLNSEAPADIGSPQYQWLARELQTGPSDCIMAYWHHPLFNSGFDGNISRMREIYRLLYEFRAELVITGHAHSYERFAPQDANGRSEPERGIRQFVVGTGGAAFTPLVGRVANSEVRQNDTYGVLKLTLHNRSYDWEFVPIEGRQFRDLGSGSCH